MESLENVFVLSSDEQSIPTITYQLSKAKSLESYFKGKGMAYTRAAQSETIFTLPLGTVNLSSGLGIINEEAGKVTYSFPLHSFEKEDGVLYSFILKENSDGTVSSSYILEYKMSDVFFTGYSSGQLSLSQFEGTIRRLGLNSSRTARGAGEDQLCPYQTVGAGDDSSNSGTGDGNIPNDHGDPIGGDGDSGTGDSNGGGPGGGTPPALDCVTTTMVINCGCSGQGCAPGFHPVASCGMNGKYDKNASFLTVVKCLDPDKSMKSSKNNILEPCDGEEDVILIDDEEEEDDEEICNVVDSNESFYDCSCNSVGEEIEWVNNLDENEEPKWGQLANKSEIIEEINSIYGLEDLSFTEQVQALANHFERNLSYTRVNGVLQIQNLNNDVNRYVYTEVGGWIDLHHTFKIFEWATENGPFAAVTQGELGEMWQSLKDNYSAYSYEDLPSNLFGVGLYVRFSEQLANQAITWQEVLEISLDEIGWKEPEDAPNFGFIPHIVNEFYPQNFTYSPLLGEDLANYHQQIFCSRPVIEQLNIIEAHELFPR